MHDQNSNTIVLPNYQEYSHLLSICKRKTTPRRLFIKHGGILKSFPLTGRQQFGRLPAENPNDICIMNPIVSRRHGFFETIEGHTFYTATQTTNGISLNGHLISPGERKLLKDGDELLVPSHSLDETKEGVTVICAFSERRIQMWDSVMETQFDALTMLPGRKLFEEWFNTEFYYYDRTDFCLFLLDIDKFKDINDSYGHDAGDEALKALSEILLETIENIHYIGRWGGDEFVGVLKGEVQTAARTLAQMNRQLSAIPIKQKFFVSLSIGVCKIGADAGQNTLERLLSHADSALYQAKKLGRGRVEIYTC